MINKGFTLIESLLYVAISSIVIFSVSFLLITVLQTNIKNQTVSEVEEQGAFVSRLITQTIRKSTGVNVPVVQSGDVLLSLQMSESSKNPTIFSVINGTLNIKEGVSAVVPITNSIVSVSDLFFNNYSAVTSKGSIKFSFSLSYKNNNGRNEYEYNKTFYGAASTR